MAENYGFILNLIAGISVIHSVGAGKYFLLVVSSISLVLAVSFMFKVKRIAARTGVKVIGCSDENPLRSKPRRQ